MAATIKATVVYVEDEEEFLGICKDLNVTVTGESFAECKDRLREEILLEFKEEFCQDETEVLLDEKVAYNVTYRVHANPNRTFDDYEQIPEDAVDIGKE